MMIGGISAAWAALRERRRNKRRLERPKRSSEIVQGQAAPSTSLRARSDRPVEGN